MRNLYLASAYERKPEICGYRDKLVALGYVVTSRWIDQDEGLDTGLGKDELNAEPSRGLPYALADIEDIGAADTIISFTGGGGRGGRHVEFGIAWMMIKQLIIIGPREHVFHCLPGVQQWPDFLTFYYNLTIGATG